MICSGNFWGLFCFWFCCFLFSWKARYVIWCFAEAHRWKDVLLKQTHKQTQVKGCLDTADTWKDVDEGVLNMTQQMVGDKHRALVWFAPPCYFSLKTGMYWFALHWAQLITLPSRETYLRTACEISVAASHFWGLASGQLAISLGLNSSCLVSACCLEDWSVAVCLCPLSACLEDWSADAELYLVFAWDRTAAKEDQARPQRTIAEQVHFPLS